MAQQLSLSQLLKTQFDKEASDLHITAGSPPQIRIDGDLCPLKVPPLRPDDSASLCYSVLTEEQKRTFEETSELDLSFTVRGLARFRANIFRQKGMVGGVFRLIPQTVRSFESLKLPPIAKELCDRKNGLVLVTGTTGSGKSTTLAAMIDYINETKPYHILTIEDPIEFSHKHKRCLINQRELGADTNTITAALKSALRQDPDVVLIGEMRDLPTISAALTIAETGHLVFATLHTNSAVSTINRIIDVFPAHQQDQVRTQLASTLQGVLCQQLLPGLNGGRVLSLEVMVPTAGIRSQIREDKVHMIQQTMQVAPERSGIETRNKNLLRLLAKRLISPRVALESTNDSDELRALLNKLGGRAA